MELKEGMYVRYKHLSNTKISKIFRIDNSYEDVFVALDNDDGTLANFIIKASDNLTDLIEQDDLLEIRYLIKSNEYQKETVQVIKTYAGKLYVNTFPRKIFVEDFDRYGIEILSIVTKEQFNSVKYEVE